jgi:hypothetical protein
VSPARIGRRGLASDSGGLTHMPEPKPGTIRSARIGEPPESREYPHEAVCLGCDQVIRLGQEMPIGPIGRWQHTGRIYGQS